MIKNLISITFIAFGCIFFLTTAIAMVRFSDLYSRLHAGSKSLTGGTVSFLLAYIFQLNDGIAISKLLVIITFLVLTNAVSTHALARTAYRQNLYKKDMHFDEYEIDHKTIDGSE